MKKRELFVLVGVLALDLLSKYWVSSVLGLYESITVIPGFFWLTYLRNTGAAWSIFEGQLGFFLIIAAVAMLGMIYFFFKTPRKNQLLRFALIFMFVGTLGNFIDRAMFTYVRDFLSFNTFGYMFPVFNVADMALNVGAGLLILEALLERKK
ncbi:MAG: signal peptidase II [Erysipelotrichales bacterium]|nr:MAG: signal peptidase II [Erysipelotrichales bacterium]